MTRENWYVERVMTKHTHGEWWVDEFNRVRSCDSDAFIAHMSDGDFPDHREYDEDTQAANARLIAAAPDLLKALELAKPFIRWDSNEADEGNDVLNKVDQAIQTARGE